MTKYELMIVIQGQIPEDLAKEVSGKVKKIIEDFKAKDLKEDFWGRRRLAYEMNHQEHGYYDVFSFKIDGEKVEKLESEMRLINEIIRSLIVKKEDIIEVSSKPRKVKEDKEELKNDKKEEEKASEFVKAKSVSPVASAEKEKTEEKQEKQKKVSIKKEIDKKEHLKGLDEKIDEILKD